MCGSCWTPARPFDPASLRPRLKPRADNFRGSLALLNHPPVVAFALALRFFSLPRRVTAQRIEFITPRRDQLCKPHRQIPAASIPATISES